MSAESGERRAKSGERRAESGEQRAESEERRAESGERRAEQRSCWLLVALKTENCELRDWEKRAESKVRRALRTENGEPNIELRTSNTELFTLSCRTLHWPCVVE